MRIKEPLKLCFSASFATKSEKFSFDRLHEQLNESDDAAQCYMLYIQDIFSCGVRCSSHMLTTSSRHDVEVK